MRSGEFTGSSIDEAVFHGLQELGLSIDEVSIETLQSESRGLFGIGAKLARVRLTERTEEDIEAAVHARHEEEVRFDQADFNTGAVRNNAMRDHAPRDHVSRNREIGEGRTRNAGQRDSGLRDGVHRRHEQKVDFPEYSYSAELAENAPAAIFLRELLAKMGIKANVLLCETEDGIRMRIDSDTRGLLIGRRGETLDALQYITNLHVNRNRKQDKYLRVTLDTEDYRSKREDTLIRLARRQVSRVKQTGRPVVMEPMNPYERRVLHSSLQGNPFVTTYSEGEEPNRHVVIAPKK